ncbi:MAG: disulfide bond formation protein DsbA, partial [Actinomycetota bacterium]
LYEINDKAEKLRDPEERGSAALRTLALLIKQGDNSSVGDLYRTIGERVHDGGEEFTSETLRKALVDAGLDENLERDALGDESTIDLVLADHNRAVEEVGGFGVPTIILPSGEGIFGPVVTIAPTGEEAGELWDHVRWLTEHDDFFELKRERGERRPGR